MLPDDIQPLDMGYSNPYLEELQKTIEQIQGSLKINGFMKRPKTPSGNQHHCWSGGSHIAGSRNCARQRNVGFIILGKTVPNERFEYHHIHPDLPYVVPCPARIHRIFTGRTKYHFQNVNAMLGIRLVI